MDAIHTRSFALADDHAVEHVQWIATAGLIAALVLIGALGVRELRAAVSLGIATDDVAESTLVSREAVSVPTLVVGADQRLRLGELRSDAVAQLAALKLLRRTEEAGPLGLREFRTYQGVALVFEPFERAGAPRVAAIYLQ